MSVEVKKLTVSTDDERKQWMELLTKASHYHYDMSGQFSPEILGDTEMEEVSTIHRAWGKAIQDAVPLLQTIRQCQLMLGEIDVTDILKDIDGRVLVVRNTENDPWYSEEDAEYFASQIKDGVSLSMDNNGHLAPYTSPVKTNALIELWMNK